MATTTAAAITHPLPFRVSRLAGPPPLPAAPLTGVAGPLPPAPPAEAAGPAVIGVV